MTGPSLQRTAALSLLVHVSFLVLLVVLTRKTSDFVMPSPYVVRLVSPGPSQTAKPAAPRAEPLREEPGSAAPEKAKAPPPKAEEKGVRVAPEKPAAPAKKAPEKPAPAEDARDYKSERLEAMREKKEMEQYLADRLSAIESKTTLKKVAALGQAVSVEAKPQGPDGGTGGEQGVESSILSDYYSRVQDEIWQQWVFPDTGVGQIEAVVAITIMKDGRVRIDRVEKTSGNALFDRSVVRAIEKASPLPRPPYQMEIGVRFTPYAR